VSNTNQQPLKEVVGLLFEKLHGIRESIEDKENELTLVIVDFCELCDRAFITGLDFDVIFKDWVVSIKARQYKFMSIQKLRFLHPDPAEFTEHYDFHRSHLTAIEQLDFVAFDPPPAQGTPQFDQEAARHPAFNRVVDSRNRQLTRHGGALAIHFNAVRNLELTWDLIEVRRARRLSIGDNSVHDRGVNVYPRMPVDHYVEQYVGSVQPPEMSDQPVSRARIHMTPTEEFADYDNYNDEKPYEESNN
jgi:hypothetical protein